MARLGRNKLCSHSRASGYLGVWRELFAVRSGDCLVLSVLWAELCTAKGNPRMVWFFPRGKEIRREKALILMGGRSLGSLRQIPGNVSKWIQLNK